MIEFLDARGPDTSTVEFEGGPRDKERATPDQLPTEIELPGGSYIRSVRCADDGALRYVWNPRDPSA